MSAFSKFSSISDDIRSLNERIEQEKTRSIDFGIKFLNDSLVCISPSDLVVLGGRAGGGKTEMALHVALNAAIKKKKVYFFALESDKSEIGDRYLYKVQSSRFYESGKKYRGPVNYAEWRAGRLPAYFYEGNDDIAGSFDAMDTFKIRYIDTGYTLEDFEKDMIVAGQDADLVVLDHLHYFDLDDSENENSQYKKIVKTIRSLCIQKRIPVILVSHIRKQDSRFASIVPDQEDFHGSSDIVKIATKAIMLGSAQNKGCYSVEIKTEMGKRKPVFTEMESDPHEYRTFVRAAKHRRNGSVMASIGLLKFDIRTNSYLDDYVLGTQQTVESRPSFILLDEGVIPGWAINEKRSKKNPPSTSWSDS